MAEVGKIYYAVDHETSSDYDRVYLSGSLEGLPDSSHGTSWVQDSTKMDEKPPWIWTEYPSDANVTKDYYVNILTEIMPISLAYFFSTVDNCYCLRIVGIENLNTEHVTSMYYTFYNCRKMISNNSDPLLAAICSFNTSNVTNMSGMFSGLRTSNESPFTLDLRQYDTSKVTDFSHMFSSSYRLSIDMTNFNTSSATDMSWMFYGSNYLNNLDVSSFDMSNVINAVLMFGGNNQLTTIYAGKDADWSAYSNLSSTNMFQGLPNLVGGNGTAHGTSTSAADNDKTRARIDKEGQAGYFTVARRTLTTSVTGNGIVSGAGEYDYGTVIDAVVSPESSLYYTESVEKTTDLGTDILLNADSLGEHTFSFTLTRNTDISAVFKYRNEHELTVAKRGGDYKVSGAGTYRYLDRPILITDMNEGLIIFSGWLDENGDILSTRNPYTFTMPDNDLNIIASFDESPFKDVPYRQFILVNGNGELFTLATQENNEFLDVTEGLGFTKNLSTFKIGQSEEVQFEQYEMPQPKGTLYFYAEGNSNVYKQYNDFIRGIMVKPLTLWYKLPIEEDEESSYVYHIPVEVTEIGKVDIEEKTGALECPVTFYATEFWKETETSTDIQSEIYNSGDFPCGALITITKQDGTAFENPEIIFKDILNDDSYYGKCSISGSYNTIILDTKNKEEHIELYDGTNLFIEDAFNFIDFSKSDGSAQFPFPKLKNGVSTEISVEYDNKQATDVVDALVIFDKEYVSV